MGTSQLKLDLFGRSAFERIDWVIFDADNTLWDLEALYDNARLKLTRLLAARGFSADEVEEFQRAKDVELFAEHGRTPYRFAQSFIETLLHFRPAPTANEAEYVWGLADKVFRETAEPYPGVKDSLERISKVAKIAILTMGVEALQRRRLRQFPYLSFVDEWKIVPNKDATAFRSFVESKNIDPYHSWMVGDSMRSDIIPARIVGLNTILVETNNWAPIELGERPYNVSPDYSVSSVFEAVELLIKGLKLARG